MVGIEKLFYDVNTAGKTKTTGIAGAETEKSKDAGPVQKVVKNGHFFVFGDTAKKVIMEHLVRFANWVMGSGHYSIKEVGVGEHRCYVIQSKTENHIRLTERPIAERNIAIANMGEDLGLGVLAKILNAEKPISENDLYESLTKIGGPISSCATNFTKHINNDKLEPQHKMFIESLFLINARSQIGRLQEVISILSDIEKREAFRIDLEKNLKEGSTFNPGDALAGLTSPVFLLNSLLVQLKEYDEDIAKGPDKGGIDKEVTFREYIEDKAGDIRDKRMKELAKQDICFLQECDVSLLREDPNKIVLGSDKVIMVNKQVYEVVPAQVSGPAIGKNIPVVWQDPKTKRLRFFEIPQGNVKFDKDNSFYGDDFRAVIVKDKVTGKKQLICSIYVTPYTIGDAQGHAEAAIRLKNVKQIIERIAEMEKVDDCILGGDFNSVEEDVGDLQNPLKTLTGSGGYTQVPNSSNTELAPPQYISASYSRARRIDHIMHKSLDKTTHALVDNATLPEGAPDPKNEANSIFDHAMVKTTFRV